MKQLTKGDVQKQLLVYIEYCKENVNSTNMWKKGQNTGYPNISNRL